MKAKKLHAVCMLVTDVDAPSGGVQRNSRILLREMNKRGIETFVCARNYYNLPGNETKDGTFFHRSPVVGKSMVINSMIYLVDSFFWLIRNRKKYDVIHCQQLFGSTMAAAAASFFVKKPILTRTTSAGEMSETATVRQMPFSGVRLRLLRRVSKFVALTGEMKKEIESLGILSDRIQVIYNATEIPAEAAYNSETKAKFRRKLNLEYEKIAVFTGRISREKGLDVLLKAWKIVAAKYPQAHLLLLGEGGDYRSVEREMHEMTEHLNLGETVHFLGYVANPKEYLLASDVFVLPSRSEGMSNSLVEAMACGTAIVACDIEANKEICEDGANSLLTAVDDENRFAEAVLKILDAPELGEKLGQNARGKAERELSMTVMVAHYIKSYEDIINLSE